MPVIPLCKSSLNLIGVSKAIQLPQSNIVHTIVPMAFPTGNAPLESTAPIIAPILIQPVQLPSLAFWPREPQLH